jgi:hypothetical protein
MLNNFKIQQPKCWKDVARQIQRETDPDKICALSEELVRTIDAQVGRSPKKPPQIVKLDGRLRKAGDH